MPAEARVGDNVYAVGVKDWNLRSFHGYRTSRGSTYNAYLVLDEKKCLIDTVKGDFTRDFIRNIERLTPLEELDYIVTNHLEKDHSEAVATLAARCPRAKVLATRHWIAGSEKYFPGVRMPLQQVATGDKISLGKNTISFLETPMLHWPDSMFSYLPEQKILFSNDAFGQHFASPHYFDDEVPPDVLREEAARYYATILLPLSRMVARLLAKVSELKLDIRMIAPSHGLIWRKDPAGIINDYQLWSRGDADRQAAVIYDTMWGSTEIIARRIVEGITEEGVPTALLSLSENQRSDIALAILRARGILLGTPVLNNLPYPPMMDAFTLLQGLSPQNRLWGIFGSYGWNKDVLERFAGRLKEASFDVCLPVFQTKFRPDGAEEKAALEYGRLFGRRLKKVSPR